MLPPDPAGVFAAVAASPQPADLAVNLPRNRRAEGSE